MASDDDRDGRARRRHADDDDRRSRRRDVHSHHDRDHSGERSHRRHRSRDGHRRRRSRTPDSPRRRRRSRDRDEEPRRRRSRDRSPRRSRHGDRRDDNGGKPERSASGREKKGSPVRRAGPLPSQEDSWAVTKGEEPEKPKEKPNYGATGVLAAASNSITQADGSTVTLKYHEPAEARKPPPRDQWKLFIFKGGDIVDTIDLGARSCWLIGRDPAIADLPAEHPSISKQHAVVQFRYTEKRNEFGDKIGRVKPYLIDLESANGTVLNGDKVPDSRYLELRNKDMVQFGHSSREYVVVLPPRD